MKLVTWNCTLPAKWVHRYLGRFFHHQHTPGCLSRYKHPVDTNIQDYHLYCDKLQTHISYLHIYLQIDCEFKYYSDRHACYDLQAFQILNGGLFAIHVVAATPKKGKSLLVKLTVSVPLFIRKKTTLIVAPYQPNEINTLVLLTWYLCHFD